MIEAWHFVGNTLRNGSPVPADGVTLRHKGTLELRRSGFHASKRIIDALKYAPGNIICRVQCGGGVIESDYKLVCYKRTILWRVDGETLLRDFARQCALNVAHLWDMPKIVRRYLETGNENIRAEAWVAARDATWTAAANAAAWAATSAVGAREAAWTAAAWAETSAAGWAATRDAHNAQLEAMVMKTRECADIAAGERQ